MYRRHRRAANVLLAAACATSLVATLGAPAHADITPDVPSVYVYEETPDWNQVYGLVPDEDDFDLGVTPDLENLPDGVPDGIPQLDPADLAPMVNLVTGVVRDVEGRAMAGVSIALTLLEVGKSTATDLATTVTNEAGRFVAQLPTTEQVMAEAEKANGTINIWVEAIKYEGTTTADDVYHGAGAIYTSVIVYNAGLTGLAFAPVNIGVLTVASTMEAHGLGGLPDAPSDDPEDPATQKQADRPAVFGGAATPVGDAFASQPVVGYEVPVPAVMVDTYLPLPDTIVPRPDEHEDSGDERCKRPANQNTWLVDDQKFSARFQPVGEIHGWLGSRTKYDYTEKAESTIGAAVNTENKGWKGSGSSYMTHDGKAKHALGWMDDYVAVPVESEFLHVWQKRTWCPYRYDEVHGPRALHEERIFTSKWTGGLRYGTRELGGDGWDAYYRARDEGRAATIYRNATFEKKTGKSYKFTLNVSAFGVGLYIVSGHDVHHKMTFKTTDRLKDWHLFGNKDVPASATNKAVYVSG